MRKVKSNKSFIREVKMKILFYFLIEWSPNLGHPKESCERNTFSITSIDHTL